MYVQDFVRLITAAVRDDEKVELKNKVTQAQVKAVLAAVAVVLLAAANRRQPMRQTPSLHKRSWCKT